MFQIADLPLEGGFLGLSPMPGRGGDYAADLGAILAWNPALVITLTTDIELEAVSAERLPEDLAAAGVRWRHVPVTDFGAPSAEVRALWPDVARAAHDALASGGKVLVHCYGGCGRSGMAALRLMTEAGEPAGEALERLRAVRPGAVETQAQRAWGAQAAAVAAGE